MLAMQARGTFRKHVTEPFSQAAAPDCIKQLFVTSTIPLKRHFPVGADPVDLCLVPRLRGQLRRTHPPTEAGAAQRGLVVGAGGRIGVAPRVRAQGRDARAGLAVLRGRRLREVSWLVAGCCLGCRAESIPEKCES